MFSGSQSRSARSSSAMLLVGFLVATGPANALRSLLMVPPWLADFRDGLYREVGNPWDPRDWKMLYDISPLFSASRIARPLLVVQGANDPRVLAQESEDIVAAVRANGVPVEYLFLDDEGHGFTKKKNEQLVFRRMKEFLDRHMPVAKARGTQVASD